MRQRRVWGRLLGIERAVVEQVEIDPAGALVISVRPKAKERDRCGVCRRRCPGFDLGEGRRRWRTLDVGTTLCFLEADAPRVTCRRHGVVVCAVPWARHSARFTRSFEDQTAWLAVNCSQTAVAALMRVAWRTVGGICARVAAEALTVVVDHDTGRLVWAAPGQDRATIERFLDQLGTERCAQLELVSCDMATWITLPVSERCPNAEVCLDPFHVVKLAAAALDVVPREVWNDARRHGQTQLAKDLKGARFALWKNPENLTARQQAKLADIQRTNQRLYRAYLLKEQLRQIYRLPANTATELLDRWLAWARRCRLPAFVKLAKTITEQRAGILAAIHHGLSNARVEAINTRPVRLTSR